MLPCVVLGGGLGTRMRSVDDRLPKPLLPVAGRPFVLHQLEWLGRQGVHELVYSIGHLGHLIREELDGRDDLWGCSVRFVDEGDQLLGTGGAVRLAVETYGLDAPFFVLYGDSYLDLDLAAVEEAHTASGLDALMTVYRNEGRWDRSNVVFDGVRVRRYDKYEPDPGGAGMDHIDYGLSILRGETVLACVPEGGPSDLAEVFNVLSVEGRLAGYAAERRFYEIGSPEGLAALEADLGSAG